MDLLVCLSTTAAFVYSLVISIVLLVDPSLVSGMNITFVLLKLNEELNESFF